ncbi:MAG: M43 family zinc metalloprotease [Bacteroidota bacterium]|nr:M43 family zinc metalloprotease [Bacteroidota bacterium]
MRTTTFRATIIALLASGGLLNAQLPCGSDDYNRRLKEQHPAEVEAAQAQLDADKNFMFQNGENRAAATYIIPVVFHIVHDYGIENISNAQVLDQMAILNRDFQKLNADTTLVIQEFEGIVADVSVEFRLANLDPEGNCTNGIDRIPSKKTNNGDDGSKLNGWPRRNYLNVWVVKSIGASGVAGYAYQPASVTGLGAAVDGIIILHDYIGSIGTGSPNNSRALTHEIGHWLDLSHPWGNTNSPGVACGDDGIPDTPKTKGFNLFCPTNSSQAIICDTVGPGVVENYQNFMEYSYCSYMFTEDQALAMHAALNSNISDRNHLSTTNNLIATGTYVIAPSVCAPKADFHSNRLMVCEGGTITFYDDSWNGTVTNRTWSFPGGSPSTSAVTSPVVTYNAAGWYPVTLTVSNVNGSDSLIRSGYIIVGNPYGEIVGPIQEGFDNSPNTLLNGWYVLNYNNDGIYWHQTNAGSLSGTSCVVLDNYNNTTGEIDDLVSPQYDLRFMTGITLTFRSAFASQVQDTGYITEKLRVLVSTNCGQSWSTLTTKQGSTLLSAGLVPGYFIPTNDPQIWKLTTVNIAATYAQARTRFKFEWTGGQYGNQFYIDDINITGTNVGISEVSNVSYFDLFPNPAQDNSSIKFGVKESQQVKITLTDLNGRVVTQIADENFSQGEHVVNFSTAGLAAGMYMVTVDDGTTKQVKKLAVNH